MCSCPLAASKLGPSSSQARADLERGQSRVDLPYLLTYFDRCYVLSKRLCSCATDLTKKFARFAPLVVTAHSILLTTNTPNPDQVGSRARLHRMPERQRTGGLISHEKVRDAIVLLVPKGASRFLGSRFPSKLKQLSRFSSQFCLLFEVTTTFTYLCIYVPMLQYLEPLGANYQRRQ